jgi:protein-disulfide isomerase
MSLRAATIALAACALALSACGKSDGDAGSAPAASSTPLAKVAAPAGQNWTEKVTTTPEGGYLLGNPEAPIKLVEYGALSCSHCAEFSEQGFDKLRDDYIADGRVSYELRLFMLNALDLPAAMLATCGAPESVIPLSEQFWAWQSQMFGNLQSAGDAQLQAAGNLPPNQRFAAIARLAGMDAFFAERGIAADQAGACLADVNKATTLSEATQKASTDKGVTGTPWFFINGRDVGTQTWATLEPMLQTAGAR